jgi:hypothetical protein
MGAGTLEASLRRRLLALVAPALIGVGVASVGVTWHALHVADRELARARANDLLRELEAELGEGDSLDLAQRETDRKSVV